MASRSKRTKVKEFTSPTGVVLTESYCRRCMKNKKPTEFYKATDRELDSNGLFSVCKQCILELYDVHYLVERTLDKTILKLCRILNIIYDPAAVDSVRNQINNAQGGTRKIPNAFSIYVMRLGSMYARGKGMESQEDFDMTFNGVSQDEVDRMDSELATPDAFWGDKYSPDQLDFLEREYANFKMSYSPDAHADVVLLKRVCKKLLAIREEEDSSGKNVGNLEKQLMALMKELAISPAHASAASGGKSIDAFGVWVADIEKTKPAEWLAEDGRELHFDVDNVHEYYENYVARPIRNYLTGTSNFNLVESGYVDGEEELPEEE